MFAIRMFARPRDVVYSNLICTYANNILNNNRFIYASCSYVPGTRGSGISGEGNRFADNLSILSSSGVETSTVALSLVRLRLQLATHLEQNALLHIPEYDVFFFLFD